MKAIVVEKNGGPEELQLQEVEAPVPKKGEAVVRLEACGVNFIDVYHRTGLYPMPLPFIPGSEAAGVVEELGPEVTELKVGDRVAYAMAPGAYAERQSVAAWKLVPIPEFMSAKDASAAMLQGMTTHYLVRGSYCIKPGDRVLIHAAAGGVGALLVRAAKHLGALVIGTVSTPEKAAIAREAGADHVILYTQEDFAEATKRITDGAGVHAVYDSVGQSTFDRSLDCLRPRGILVLFGQSSGPVPPFDPGILARKGSLFLTRPSLAHYTSNRQELLVRSGEVFEWIRSGALKIRIDHTFPLSGAADAHRRLESRASAGKLLLLP